MTPTPPASSAEFAVYTRVSAAARGDAGGFELDRPTARVLEAALDELFALRHAGERVEYAIDQRADRLAAPAGNEGTSAAGRFAAAVARAGANAAKFAADLELDDAARPMLADARDVLTDELAHIIVEEGIGTVGPGDLAALTDTLEALHRLAPPAAPSNIIDRIDDARLEVLIGAASDVIHAANALGGDYFAAGERLAPLRSALEELARTLEATA